MSKFEPDPRNPAAGIARLLGGQRILRSQLDVLLATLGSSLITLLGVFGAWRGGKTTGEMLAALSLGIQNPWIEDYGGNRPTTLMVTETVTVMRDSMYAALTEVFPEGVIVREVRSPAWDIEIPNGHVYSLRTDRGAIEGATVCSTLVDEVHKMHHKKSYVNYSARASDARAAKNMVIACGLPIDNGWLREEFDRPDDARRKAIYMRTADNTHLPPGYVDRLRSSCSAREARTLLDAEWHVFEGAIYDEFDATRHFARDVGDKRRPVHIGLDAGHQAALVVAQEKERLLVRPGERGLVVVDEMLPDGTSVEGIMRSFLSRGWRLQPGYSYICVDPRIDDDQLASIRRVLAEHGLEGVAIEQKIRGDIAESVLYGIRCVQAALLDAAGNVRLTFTSDLPDVERGLRRSLVKYRWNPRTRQPVKDDKVDHVLDALRYIVAHVLPSAAAARASELDDFTLPSR